MKNLTILALILVVPALIILGYYKFAKNNYKKLPIYGEKVPIAASAEAKVPDTIYHTIGNFSFSDQNGQSFGTKSLEDKIYVANFFFTTCKSICIDMTKELRRVQETFSKNPLVNIISFTVDPEVDNIAILNQYANKNKINYNQWKLLTGNKDSIYALAEKGFMLQVQETGGSERFLHSDQCLLIDKKQRIRGIYTSTNNREVNRLMEDIRTLALEYASDSLKVYNR